MHLTAEQFEQITASLKSDGDSQFGGHRRSPRVGLRCTATMIPIRPGLQPVEWEVRVRDLSVEGIGVVTNDRLTAASRFLIVLRRATGEAIVAIYSVAHCVAQGPREFRVGAKLEKVVPYVRQQKASA